MLPEATNLFKTVDKWFPLITHFNKFSIYKAYYISEQKTKRVDVYSFFVMEYLQIYGGIEIIQEGLDGSMS
jgi:hypothetical protein